MPDCKTSSRGLINQESTLMKLAAKVWATGEAYVIDILIPHTHRHTDPYSQIMIVGGLLIRCLRVNINQT